MEQSYTLGRTVYNRRHEWLLLKHKTKKLGQADYEELVRHEVALANSIQAHCGLPPLDTADGRSLALESIRKTCGY